MDKITQMHDRENRDVLSNIDGIKEFLFGEISKATPSIPLRLRVPTFGEKGGGSTSVY